MKNVSIPIPAQQPNAARRRRSQQPAAIRMARLRDRRKRGFCVYQIEISLQDIDVLVRRGLLDRLQRNDQSAVEGAVGLLLDKLQ